MNKLNKLKVREELRTLDKVSYASEHIDLPEGGIDCYEGCNPYGFPPELIEEAQAFDLNKLGPYPHSTAIFDGLKEYFKGQVFLEPENLMITDGSISALYIINNLFSEKGSKVLGIQPQFPDQEASLKLNGMIYEAVSMRREDNYKIDTQEILDRIDSNGHELSMIYIDNPNNPTGQIINCDIIEQIIKKAEPYGIAVVIDEAFGDFMSNENSAIKYLEKYENLIMVRTMSKGFGLAGLRIGYIIAAKPVIACMRKLRDPYMVNEFARELAGAALLQSHHIWEYIAEFAKQKREIRSVIGDNLKMAETCDTVSICLLYHEDKSVDLKKMFYDRGVLCVSGDTFNSLDKSFVRMRLPKTDEFPILLEAVKNINQSK
ncbi:MAG: histidinol-phosphate aminotransferase family protein [Clostridiales bacterium]|nr:histidinol-phosphate aminotransferase family protein [Clostridiales bacterium]